MIGIFTHSTYMNFVVRIIYDFKGCHCDDDDDDYDDDYDDDDNDDDFVQIN